MSNTSRSSKTWLFLVSYNSTWNFNRGKGYVHLPFSKFPELLISCLSRETNLWKAYKPKPEGRITQGIVKNYKIVIINKCILMKFLTVITKNYRRGNSQIRNSWSENGSCTRTGAWQKEAQRFGYLSDGTVDLLPALASLKPW